MKVLVCGGRAFDDRAALERAIRGARPFLVITGGATGADRLADLIAEDLGIARVIYPANWKGEGRAAGFLRNQRMLDLGRPDLVIAAEGGRGTADMACRAKRAGLPVINVAAARERWPDDFSDLI